MTPLPDVAVQITDGNNVYAATTTGSDGTFRLKVDFGKVSENSYLYLSLANLIVKQEKLYGIGKEVYDYKKIVLFDKTDMRFLPQVMTAELALDGLTVTTGGNVTSDGGYAVTDRGICWGIEPDPNLESANHISNGDGLGAYSVSFNMENSNSVYYIRAYATNENGTSYGQQKKLDAYDFLPELYIYYGAGCSAVYKIAPQAPNLMTREQADYYCSHLTAYGHSDWELPSYSEQMPGTCTLWKMYENRSTIGGFDRISGIYSYWSDTYSGYNYGFCYFALDFSDGSVFQAPESDRYIVRPIRRDR